MDPMAAIRETFFQECDEQLAELEAGLVAMEDARADGETVNAIFRAVHSIKGGAGAFQLDQLVRFAHAFETALDKVRSGRFAPSGPSLKTMFRSADVLADLVKAARAGLAFDEARMGALVGELDAMGEEGAGARESAVDAPVAEFEPLQLALDDLDFAAPGTGGGPGEAPANPGYRIAFRPTPELYRKGNETLRLLRELGRLGDADAVCDLTDLPLLDRLDPEGAYLSWTISLSTGEPIEAIREIFDFVVDDCDLDIVEVAQGAAPQERAIESAPAIDAPIFVPATPVAATAPPPAAAGVEQAAPQPVVGAAPAKVETAKAETATPTIRVDLERVDRLINLVGELVINQAMLSQRVMEAGVARGSGVAAGLSALEQLTREIQEGVMATRAQPVKPLFQRMARIVREAADATGKSVRLKTEGEATEVDRTVIERLADPLTHMLRNAVDHGLESAEKRRALGKPEQGEIRLTAAHRSGRIVIEVSDDGGGVDRARVRAIAVEKELIPADAQLTDSETDNLLFLPGFSTAREVSALSGRGVGMDVVKRSIQALGGRISISSRPGVGSTFSMSLPLTLAVLDGMVVRVAGETLVVPLTAIVETLRPKARDVHWLGVDARVMADRGGFVPLIDVGRELGFRAELADPFKGVVLVVETEVSTRCALIVDEISDQRQVVIKSLEANYRRVQGVAAATILGDGRVALILDLDTFVADANQRAVSARPVLANVG